MNQNKKTPTSRGRVAIVAFAVMLSSIVLAGLEQPALAFGIASSKWPANTNKQYCLDSSVSSRANWSQWIASDVANFNNAPNNTLPTWTQGSCSVNFTVSGTGGCGVTTTSVSGGVITSSIIRYRTNVNYWRTTNTGGCNFDYTTLHEFGHSQGLPHSYVTTAVMYGSDNAKIFLTNDDIQAVQCSYPTASIDQGFCSANNHPAP